MGRVCLTLAKEHIVRPRMPTCVCLCSPSVGASNNFIFFKSLLPLCKFPNVNYCRLTLSLKSEAYLKRLDNLGNVLICFCVES